MAKYGYYVVDKTTGLVHAGNEFREDAADARREMIDEGVPASRATVMTATGVRRAFGRIKWGTGRPGVRSSAPNGKAKRRAAPKVQFMLVVSGYGPEIELRGKTEAYALKAADKYGRVVKGWERRGRGEWEHVLDVFPKGEGTRPGTWREEIRVFWR